MRIVKIQLDDFYQNISFLGLSSILETYQLAWLLNKSKDFCFSKDLKNLELDCFKTENNNSTCFLIKNKKIDEIPLFPYYKNIDFLLFFNDEEMCENSYEILKNHDNISVYRFNFEILNKKTKAFIEKMFL